MPNQEATQPVPAVNPNAVTNRQERGNGKRWLATAVVGLLAISAVGIAKISGGEDPTSSAEADGANTAAELLTVNPNDVDPDICLGLARKTGIGEIHSSKRGDFIKQNIGATETGRKSGDALGLSIKDAEDTSKVQENLAATNCEDALRLGAWGNALAATSAGDGKSILDYNPWLQKFSGPTNNIAKVARDVFPVAPRDTEKQPLTDEEEKKIFDAAEVNKIDGARMVTLVLKFASGVYVEGATVESSYALAASGQQASGVPEVRIDNNSFVGKGDKAPYLLKATTKSQGCVTSIAVDAKWDGRPERVKDGCKALPTPNTPATLGKPEKPGKPNKGTNPPETNPPRTSPPTTNGQGKPPVANPPTENSTIAPKPPEGPTPYPPITRQVAPVPTQPTLPVDKVPQPATTLYAAPPSTNKD